MSESIEPDMGDHLIRAHRPFAFCDAGEFQRETPTLSRTVRQGSRLSFWVMYPTSVLMSDTRAPL